jgi:hypothetical protein
MLDATNDRYDRPSGRIGPMTATAGRFPRPMTHEFGDRIGASANLSIGAAVAVLDQDRWSRRTGRSRPG